MQSLLAIAMESGDQELIDLYTAQLAELERQLAVLHEVLGTQTVQDLQAAADAAAAAEQNTADLVERFMQMGADPAGAITSAYDAVEELRKALELAILTPGTPMDVINELLAAYQAAQVTAAQMATDAAKMFQAGLIDAEELAAMAEAGGQAFIDGFNDAMGDPNAYDDIVQAQEDALDAVRQVQLDQLKLMIEDAEDGGISLVDELIDGVLSGATDFEDALEVINQIAEQNGEGLQTTLADLYLSLQDDLQAALAAGTDTTIIEQNMQIIRDILASLGLEIDDVLGKATQAAIAAQSWNKSGGPGGSLGNSNYAGRRSTMDVMGAATDIYSANNAALLAGTSAYPNTSSAMTQAMSQGASTSVAVAAPEVTVNTQNYMDSRPLVTTTIQQIVSAVPPGRRM
jgi:hypothetical protein